MDSTPTPSDVAYIVSNYRRLPHLCQAWGETETETREYIARGLLPRPAYVLAGKLEFFPDDYFVFPREASPLRRKQIFSERLKAALAGYRVPFDGADAESAWQSYLTGEYGISLRIVLPETIARKACLIASIAEALEKPVRTDEQWRNSLLERVDALDALLRCGAKDDRERYVANVRNQFSARS
jgi:hypothetical protein